MATIFEIDKAADEYAKAHDALRSEVGLLELAIAAAKQAHLKSIRVLVSRAATRKAALKDLIEDARELFDRPKTRILHGVKVGLQKGKGKLDWDDDAQVVALIRKHFPDLVETLVRIKELPVAGALNELDARDLRRIGVRVEESGDQVVIKPTDSEIDRLVDALLADEEPEAA